MATVAGSLDTACLEEMKLEVYKMRITSIQQCFFCFFEQFNYNEINTILSTNWNALHKARQANVCTHISSQALLLYRLFCFW